MPVSRADGNAASARATGAGARAPALAVLAVVPALSGLAGRAGAQEMEPRSYSPAPVGLNFLGGSYLHSSGGIAVDPSAPVDNVDASFDSATLGVARTFALAGRTANVAVALPYFSGDVSGDVQEERRSVTRDGFGDARLRLAVNLAGAPAMDPADFSRRMPRTTLGASLSVIAPTGEYKPGKLVNLGSNRWAFKPELGVYQPLGRWALEASAGAWLFTDNEDYFGGQRRQQDPLATAQLHVSYTLRPGLWFAGSANWYGGGDTTLDGAGKADRQDSTRLGVTMSVPLSRSWSLKLAWSDGVTTRIGSDFSTFAVAWQYAWQSAAATPRRAARAPEAED